MTHHEPCPGADVGGEQGHDWVVRLNDEGDQYEVCSACGKQDHWLPAPAPVGAELI